MGGLYQAPGLGLAGRNPSCSDGEFGHELRNGQTAVGISGVTAPGPRLEPLPPPHAVLPAAPPAYPAWHSCLRSGFYFYVCVRERLCPVMQRSAAKVRSLSVMWVLGIRLGSPGLVTSAQVPR